MSIDVETRDNHDSVTAVVRPSEVHGRNPRGRNNLIRARMPSSEENFVDDRPAETAPSLAPDDRSPQGGDSENSPKRSFLRRHILAVGLLGIVSLSATGYLFWDHNQRFESTDDAFIAARAFSVASKVSGYITAVTVTDNQHVETGEVIAQIDQRDYRIAVEQARAQLTHDEAILRQAETNLARYQSLIKTSAIAKQQVDDQAFLVEQNKSTVALDLAKVDAAQQDLSHTTVTAAQSGRVVSLTSAVGQFMQAGTTLSYFVPDDVWVTANFKETQLKSMRAGQGVTVKVDAYPGRKLHGHIASIQPGSGTAFSLLPPQNATGNYVKIVQRVPVKIVIDNPPADLTLGPGMSVMPIVRVGLTRSLFERLEARL